VFITTNLTKKTNELMLLLASAIIYAQMLNKPWIETQWSHTELYVVFI